MPEPLRLDDPAARRDPHPLYARLRAEAPVHRLRLPGGREAWLLLRHADVAAMLRDPRLMKDPASAGRKRPWVPRAIAPLTRNMLDLDDPDHARLRRLAGRAFTPRRVEARWTRPAAGRHRGIPPP
jgi:cytochrome P450 PksS